MTDKLNYTIYSTHLKYFLDTICASNEALQEFLGGDPKWTLGENIISSRNTKIIYYDNFPVLITDVFNETYGGIFPYSEGSYNFVRNSGFDTANWITQNLIHQDWWSYYSSYQSQEQSNLIFHDFDSFMLITRVADLTSYEGVNSNPDRVVFFFDKKNKEHFSILKQNPILISLNHYELNPMYPTSGTHDSSQWWYGLRTHDASSEEIKYYKLTSLHNREATRVYYLTQFPEGSCNQILDAEGKSIFVLPYTRTVGQVVTSPWYPSGSKELNCAFGVDVTGELIN